jgi:hypothetical protein
VRSKCFASKIKRIHDVKKELNLIDCHLPVILTRNHRTRFLGKGRSREISSVKTDKLSHVTCNDVWNSMGFQVTTTIMMIV